MDWPETGLHIENLLPGIVTTTLVVAIIPESVMSTQTPTLLNMLLENGFAAAGIFVAISYLLGILIVAISRLIFDPLSMIFTRPIVFKLYYPETFRGLGPAEVQSLYWTATQVGLTADSDYKREEVKLRRERARLLRAFIIPVCMASWYLLNNHDNHFRAFAVIAAFAVILFLYSYLELAVYDETGFKKSDK
ncbi:MAG: hypothetical protein GY755_06720 [Chloroflexi bacterium]|nr:hypothetical protein [Chloroflexota bacterium]